MTMKFEKTDVTMQPEILKRKLGGELLVPVTVVAETVVKAGTPITADGTVVEVGSESDAVGILLNDVNPTENPNGSLIKAFACVNATVGQAHSGVTYSSALKAALPLIVFE